MVKGRESDLTPLVYSESELDREAGVLPRGSFYLTPEKRPCNDWRTVKGQGARTAQRGSGGIRKFVSKYKGGPGE